MKQIAIIGATGATGKEVVRLALETNYNVIIVVRNLERIQPEKNVTVVKGDVTDLESLELAFKNVDLLLMR